MKPGDWICPMCGDLVFARRDNCGVCGFGGDSGNPLASMMAMMSQVPHKPGTEKPFAGNGHTKYLKPGDWRCGQCSALNMSNRKTCYGCGADKSATFKPKSMRSSPDGNGSSSSGGAQ